MLNLNKTSTNKRTEDSDHSESKSKSKSSRNSRNGLGSKCKKCLMSILSIILPMSVITVSGVFLAVLMDASLNNIRDTACKTQRTTKECSISKRGSYVIRYKLEVEYPNGKHGVIIKNKDVLSNYYDKTPDECRFTMKEFHLNGRICIIEFETLSERIPTEESIYNLKYQSINELKENLCIVHGICHSAVCDIYNTTFEKYGDLTYKVIGLLDSDIIDKYDNLIYDCITKTHYKSLKIR